MYKKILVALVSLLCLGGMASAQMTDDAVMKYVAQALASGKSQSQVSSELIARGVSAAQIGRLLNQYQSKGAGAAGAFLPIEPTRLDEARPTREVDGMDELSDRTRPRAQQEEILEPEDSVDVIFGHDIFSQPALSFEPNVNAATPQDYVLGPGDEIVIDIWGVNEATIRQTISPEGRIIVSQVGSLDLSGLTIAQATSKIKNAFARRYAGINGQTSQISVTLGNIRTVQVSIVENVKTPGTYRLSSFTTVFNALYRAGGVTPNGSLRAVKVVRAGETVAEVDLYSFIFNGRQDENVALKDGDVLIVPPYLGLVKVQGGVKRPMLYETKPGDSVESLLAYAGGFTGDAYQGEVNVSRYDGKEKTLFSVPASRFAVTGLQDGDVLTVPVTSREEDIFANRVEVRGAVYRPGEFALGGDIVTVGQLVSHAGGLLEDAFLNRAQIIREKPDRTMEILAVPIGAIIAGTADDVMLRKNDILLVSNINEVEPKGDLTITGYVLSPGQYQYADNMSVEDLILLAGGLSEGASTVKVEVSRRINESASLEAPETIAEVFSFEIADGLMVDGYPKFTLQPNDIVSIRRSPSYIEQRNVSITGEVTFPGQYTLTNNNYRVSELVSRAGGPTSNANVRGAMLKRSMSQYERNVRTGISRVVAQQDEADSIKVDKLKVNEIYTVGLELDKALAHPGSDYDIILRDGDELILPENITTVRIQGEVLYPNTVHYISGKPIHYYVNQAGGYSNSARRSKTYVLYMNGTVATGGLSPVEAGCEIIVPKKRERSRLSATEIFSIGSSAASIAAVIATIVNLVNSNKE